MDDFLAKANRLALTPQQEDHKKAVFDAIADLREVQAKSKINLDNIESVFGAFEMARILGRMGDRDSTEVEKLARSLKQLIVYTLESSMGCILRDDRYWPPQGYEQFAKMIWQLREDRKDPPISIVTFNYDVALEYALKFYGLQYEYATENTLPANTISIMKLHGSLNWHLCNVCRNIVWSPYWPEPNPWSKIGKRPDRILLQPSIHFNFQTHCSEPLLPEPLIIPPTWNKTQYCENIGKVWVNAANALREADNIFIIGYSLPTSDEFFKYLFALGTITREFLDCLWVINPDESIRPKYDDLIAEGIKKRYRFHSAKFTDSIDLIQHKLSE